MVYTLCGLTPEEIAIVEGKGECSLICQNTYII